MSNKYYKHGIDSNQFNSININENLSNLFKYKIKLTKQGFASRFFLTLGFPLDKYFLQQKEISFIELIHSFFLSTKIGISNKTMFLVMEDLKRYIQITQPTAYSILIPHTHQKIE
ncbi:hypothetical protein LCGC14_1274550 [marine sediment metagenome]|uniref:Uncharacterized protein n=1 Tax=marine sediment metagenome TaxID=412755 RepID=A0A0F9P075_9ZZZZ